MKKLSVLVLITLALTCGNSYAQEYDYYDEPVYDDSSSSNDYPEKDQEYYNNVGSEQQGTGETYCGVNKEGDKYCTYGKDCYEYWNKNGSHYYHCPKNEGEAQRQVKLEEILNQVSRESSCGKNYPGTILDENGNCVCPDEKKGGPGWDSANRKCHYIDELSSPTHQTYQPTNVGEQNSSESDSSYWIFPILAIAIALFFFLRSDSSSKIKNENL